MQRFFSIIPNFRRLRLPVILATITALFVGACNPSNFRSEAAETSQLILSQLSEPKTFNLAPSQESPNFVAYAVEDLTTLDAVRRENEQALAETW